MLYGENKEQEVDLNKKVLGQSGKGFLPIILQYANHIILFSYIFSIPNILS